MATTSIKVVLHASLLCNLFLCETSRRQAQSPVGIEGGLSLLSRSCTAPKKSRKKSLLWELAIPRRAPGEKSWWSLKTALGFALVTSLSLLKHWPSPWDIYIISLISLLAGIYTHITRAMGINTNQAPGITYCKWHPQRKGLGWQMAHIWGIKIHNMKTTPTHTLAQILQWHSFHSAALSWCRPCRPSVGLRWRHESVLTNLFALPVSLYLLVLLLNSKAIIMIHGWFVFVYYVYYVCMYVCMYVIS